MHQTMFVPAFKRYTSTAERLLLATNPRLQRLLQINSRRNLLLLPSVEITLLSTNARGSSMRYAVTTLLTDKY